MNKRFDEQKAVSSGIIDLIRHKVFYGHILSQLGKVYMSGENASIGTFAVGKKPKDMLIKLYVNKDFVKDLQEKAETEDEYWGWMGGILEHEVLHLVFDHLSLHFADRTRGNVAVDCVVNSLIEKKRLPKNCIWPDMFNLEPNKSATWYYEQLGKNEKYQKMCSEGAFGAGGILSHAMNAHGMWDSADPLLKEFVKDVVRQAKDLCNKQYGNIPSQVIEQLDDLLKNKPSMIPWNKILRQFVANATESNLDYTMKRTSKRYGCRPGIKKEDLVNLAVAIDTSGSISNEMLEVFLSEIQWISKNGAFIHIYEADCEIAHDYKFTGKFNTNVHGRGGTDLEPVLKECEGKYDALVYFTDFYAPNIETRYRIPTLWVLTTDLDPENYPYKWGKCVKIDI